MAKILYTAEARVTGGRDQGHGATNDGALEVQLRLPQEMGGNGDAGTNPEQLFAVGYAACFEGAIGAVARRQKVETGDAVIVSKVSLSPNDSRGFELSVELDVTLPSVDDEQAVELVRAAHHVCPYSNATRGNIPVSLVANGEPSKQPDPAGCDTGVCGADVPPMIGSVLTGTGLTVAQAAAALSRGDEPALTDVQRRIVERWMEERGG